MWRSAAYLFIWVWLAGFVPAELTPMAEATVTGVIDGDTVTLDTGRQVRLVGIQAPKLPLGRAGFKPWPLGEAAKAVLQGLIQGKKVRLFKGQATEDRHGRILAHLVRGEDALWVQGEMLRLGMARVYSFPDNRKGVAVMLRLEAEARDARRGIWADPFYAIRTAENIHAHGDGFQIVEARVRTAATVKGRVYLNFGDDWRQDFTVKVERRWIKSFDHASPDLTGLAGRLMRVRGWVTFENGPMIEVTHPEQMEVLD